MPKKKAETKVGDADTAPKQQLKAKPGIPFTKNDPRINRKGRPKNFDQLRALAQSIAGEKLGESDITRIQAMMMAMSTSRNPRDRELFLQYAFGKVKDEVQYSGDKNNPITIKAYDYSTAIAPLAARPDEDSDSSSEDKSHSDGAAVGEDSHDG